MLALIDSVLSNCHEYLMISSLTWYYDISRYLRRNTKEPIGFIMGVSTALKLFNENLYDETSGNLLEALGKLFAIGAKVYVYNMSQSSLEQIIQETGTLWDIDSGKEEIGLNDITPLGPNQFLFKYLTSSHYFVSI